MVSSCISTKNVGYFDNARETEYASIAGVETAIQANDILSISISSLNPEASAIFNTTNVQSNNIQHIVPIDTVSKYELLKLFNKYFKKNINIFPKYCNETVNKTLSTVDPIMNSTLWGNKIKSIEEMISDIAEA